MSHDSRNRITKPVRLKEDVAYVTGMTTGDLGAIIREGGGNINKWALYKPIRHNKIGYLTREEFRGMNTDYNAGVYFGLKMSASGTIDNDTSTWTLMHSVIWEYQRPRGRERNEWFRLTDFCDFENSNLGYNPEAVPNPEGSLPVTGGQVVGYYNTDKGIDGIVARYYETNKEGVDLTMILKTPSNTLDYVLERTFPCALVTDSRGNSYFTALFFADADTPRPLRYNSAYLGGTWYLKINKNVFSGPLETGQPAPPWNEPMSGMKITLFLLRIDTIRNEIPYLDAGYTQSLKDYWFNCADGIASTSHTPVPLPNGTNVSLVLKSFITIANVTALIAISGTSGGFNVNYRFTQAHTGSIIVTITVYITTKFFGTTTTKTISRSITYTEVDGEDSGTIVRNYMETFRYSDQDWLGADTMQSGTEVTASVQTISTAVGGSNVGGNTGEPITYTV